MGLDVELFQDAVPDDLVCGFCRKVVVNPVLSGQCAHLFCRACLTRSEVKATCPTCGVKVKDKVTGSSCCVEPSVEMKVKLLGLRVCCSHHCGEVCTLAELPDHVADLCPNAPASCPHRPRGCKMTVKRSEVSEHSEECDYRHVQCEACGQRVLFLDLFSHQSRKKCVEKKLRQQLIKAVKITNTEVKLHRRNLERQTLRLERQQRQRFLDHHRQSTAVTKPQRHYKNHLHNNTTGSSSNNTGKIGGSGDNDATSCNGSEFETPSVVSTDVVNFDPNHPPDRGVFLTTSKTVGEEEEGEEEEKVVIIRSRTTPSPSRTSAARVSTCRNCRRQFRENLNTPSSCRWHPGPIIELFGGTCYSCGRLNYQKGCMMGYHEL